MAISPPDDVEADPVRVAEKRLFEAALKLGMTPNAAAVSAFVNGLITNCKVDALVEYTAPFELDEEHRPILRGTFAELYLGQLTTKIAGIEQAIAKPRLVTAHGDAIN